MAKFMQRNVEVEVVPAHLPASAWSATSIESFLGCPLKYWWSKVQRWNTPSTVPLVVGTSVHEALENLLALPPGKRTPRAGEEFLAAAVDKTLRSVSGQAIDPAAVTERAQRAMGAYWDTEDPGDVEVASNGIEREVKADIGGLAFRGFIDRIAVTDAGLRVTDYKTGAAKPKYWWGYWRQQLLFAHSLGLGDEPIAEVELLFLTSPRAVTRPVYGAAVQRALDDLDVAHTEREHMQLTQVWQARTGPLCNYCDFAPACPAKRSRAPRPGTAESDELLRQQGLWQREKPAAAIG